MIDIGGCANQQLTQDIARYVPTWAYEFDHRTGPGLTPIPGYVWGAGHAIELAYLFPRFDNGTPIAPTFNAGERTLAAHLKASWGRFVRGALPWAPYNAARVTLSRRAGHHSVLVSDATVRAEHQCCSGADSL